MKIKWLGHSCFLITSKGGVRILTDPFDEQVGYELPAVEADIVTSSHDHFDHNHFGVVKGNFKRIDKPGKHSEQGVEIYGVKTCHDESGGSKRGQNIIFKYNIDGLRLCHCGDLGHVLSPEQVKEIGEVDVLLIPVGGTFTVDAAGAFEVVKQLKPAVTIPMHFKTPDTEFTIDGVDKFFAVAGGGEKMDSQEIEIDKDSLGSFPKVLVLDYK